MVTVSRSSNSNLLWATAWRHLYVLPWRFLPPVVAPFASNSCTTVATLSRTEFFTDVHPRTLDRLCQYAVFPADGRFVLQAAVILWCHRSSDQPLVAVFSRLLAQRPGTPCLKDVASSQSDYTFHLQLKTWLFKKSFHSGHHHLILTASWVLTFILPTLRRFCRLRSTIWYDMKTGGRPWDISIWLLSVGSQIQKRSICVHHQLQSLFTIIN